MLACVGNHSTPWFRCRGDELKIVLSGPLPEGVRVELEGDGDFETTLPLLPGPNTFPQGIRRYRVCKRLSLGAPEVPNTVKIVPTPR